MRRGPSPLDTLTFGGRVPSAVGGLIAGVVSVSLLAALAGAGGLLALVPILVLDGQVWRLLTWTLLERGPLNVLFAGLTLFWFGGDLCRAWGPRRFLATWFGLGAAAAAATCLLALAAPGLGAAAFDGAWVVLSGMIVAWGLLYPDRQMMFWGVVPLSGRGLVWITVGGTVFFGAFGGLGGILRVAPHLLAEALIALSLRGLSPRGAWQALRIWQGERRLRRRASHLKVVGKGGKGDPPRWLN